MYKVRGLFSEYVILKKMNSLFYVIKVEDNLSEMCFSTLNEVYEYCNGLFLVSMYFNELEDYPGAVCLLDEFVSTLHIEYSSHCVQDDYLLYEKVKSYLKDNNIGLDELFLLSLKGANIVFTGRLSRYTRSVASRKAQRCGANVQSYVTNKTNYLIKGVNQRISNKHRCALNLNIPIIEEEQFYRMIGEI